MNILVNCGYDHGTVGAQHRMRNPTTLCHLRKQKLEVVVVDEVRVKTCQSDQMELKYSCLHSNASRDCTQTYPGLFGIASYMPTLIIFCDENHVVGQGSGLLNLRIYVSTFYVPRVQDCQFARIDLSAILIVNVSKIPC